MPGAYTVGVIEDVAYPDLFRIGARWRHRNLSGKIVHIVTIVSPGRFTLGFVQKQGEIVVASFESQAILGGVWTAEELIRSFEPVALAPTRHELVVASLDDD